MTSCTAQATEEAYDSSSKKSTHDPFSPDFQVSGKKKQPYHTMQYQFLTSTSSCHFVFIILQILMTFDSLFLCKSTIKNISKLCSVERRLNFLKTINKRGFFFSFLELKSKASRHEPQMENFPPHVPCISLNHDSSCTMVAGTAVQELHFPA